MVEAEYGRRLAAILAADVVGYTQLMANDEVATVSALDAARAVFRERIESKAGRVVDMAGDSVLAVFRTATEACEAALAVQKALAGSAMQFRAGVHLGEVIEKPDGTVYGDGVNLAARLEGLAAPGGVCVSAAVHDQVGGKIEVTFADIGQHEVKNVAKPVHAFAWGGKSVAAVPLSDKGRQRSIAIGDFEARGGDSADALAVGVVDGISAALSNQTSVVMVSETGAADFIVKGRIQTQGDHYRATLRLVDSKSGETFATDRFDGNLADPFQAEDDLTYRIYTAIRFAIYGREADAANQGPDGEQDSQNILTQAAELIFQDRTQACMQAIELLDALIAREPENFMAHAMKASCHMNAETLSGYLTISPEDRAAALSAAREAVRLNAGSDFCHHELGQVLLYCERDFAAARREIERCLEINPFYAWGRLGFGMLLIFTGETEKGIELCMKAAEANSRGPGNHWPPRFVALGKFACRQYEEAVDWASRSDQKFPDRAQTLLILAAAAAQQGNSELARQTTERIRTLYPDFCIRDFGNWPFKDAEPGERLVEGLRLADLPE